MIPASKDLHRSAIINLVQIAHRQGDNDSYQSIRILCCVWLLPKIFLAFAVIAKMIINSVWIYDNPVVIASWVVTDHFFERIVLPVAVCYEFVFIYTWSEKEW